MCVQGVSEKEGLVLQAVHIRTFSADLMTEGNHENVRSLLYTVSFSCPKETSS